MLGQLVIEDRKRLGSEAMKRCQFGSRVSDGVAQSIHTD